MNRSLLDSLRCPNCKKSSFSLHKTEGDDLRVREGRITCNNCAKYFDIKKGILEFDIEDKELLREMAQWEVFAESEGWLKPNELYLESLPSAGSKLLMKKDTIGWLCHEYNFFTMLDKIDVNDKYILDLGAGRCWSSKWLTKKGGKVVAYDALAHPTIGMGAADIFFKNHGIYFDRVRGDFNELPFNNGIFDIVLSSGALHHTVDLDKTVNEAARVLKNNGLLVLVNEMSSRILTREEKVKMSGKQDGINEHNYRTGKLLKVLKSNGFTLQTINESIHVYQPNSDYYQGMFASLISKTNAGKLLYLLLRGGIVNFILKKTG